MGILLPLLMSVKPITGSVLVVNGMSVMHGFGNAPGYSITDQLCSIKGWAQIDNAQDSTTIDDLIADFSLIPYYDSSIHRYWIYGEDINDAGEKSSTPETYATKTTTLVSHVHSVKGWPKSRMKALTRFYVTDDNWDDYGQGQTTAGYLEFCDAGQVARDAFGMQSIDMWDIMAVNGDPGLDAYGRHPLDAFTPEYGAFVASLLL